MRRVDHDDDRHGRDCARAGSRRTTRCSPMRSSGRRSASRRSRSSPRWCSRQSARASPCRRSTTSSMIAVSVAAVSALMVRRIDLRRHRVPPPVPVDGAHDARLDVLAAVGDRAERRGHLQRRDGDLIAHRDGRERALGPLLRLPDDSGALRRESRATRGARTRTATRSRLSRSVPTLKPILIAPTLLDLTITSLNDSTP